MKNWLEMGIENKRYKRSEDGKKITASMLRDHEQLKRIVQRDSQTSFYIRTSDS